MKKYRSFDITDDWEYNWGRCWTASQLANILLWIAKMIWHHNLVSKFGKIAKRKVWELVGWWWGAEGDQVAEQCTMSIKLEGFYPPIYRAQESFQSIVQHKEAKIRILCNGKPAGQLQIIVFSVVILLKSFVHSSVIFPASQMPGWVLGTARYPWGKWWCCWNIGRRWTSAHKEQWPYISTQPAPRLKASR